MVTYLSLVILTGRAVNRLCNMRKQIRRPVDLSRGLIDHLMKDARFINVFPDAPKYVRVVTLKVRRGCCRSKKATVRTVKRRVVDHGGVKRRILAATPEQQAQLKRILGVKNLSVTVKQTGNKISTLTI